MKHAWLLFLILFFSGCGSALSTPEALLTREYPADQEFRITVVMTSCSDPCAEYDSPECSVDVSEDRVIEISPSVGYGDGSDENCITRHCGPEIFAHCTVGSLTPGTYTVESGSFSAEITVK